MESVGMATSLETIVGLKPNVNEYTPLLECVVNSINSIQEKWIQDWEINIEVNKGPEQWALPLEAWEASQQKIKSFRIIDNGIWFNDEKTNAFDEPFTDNNFANWGKWYGRFTTLKVFENVKIESIFWGNAGKKKREFFLRFNPQRVNNRAIISNERLEDVDQSLDEKTVITLSWVRRQFANSFDLTAKTIAKRIFEHLLPYFLSEESNCPKILVSDDQDTVSLNDFLDTEKNKTWIICDGEITLKNRNLRVVLIWIHWPYKNGTEIILTAHKRSVINTSITKYIPEFTSTFSETREINNKNKEVTFYIKAYVSWEYLDQNVDFQREAFNIPDSWDNSEFLTKEEIELEVARIIKEIYHAEYEVKFQEKMQWIQETINSEMPYFSRILKYIPKGDLPVTRDKKVLAKKLYEAQFDLEAEVRNQLDSFISSEEEFDEEQFQEYSEKVSDLNADALAHYILWRAMTIKLLREHLKVDHTTNHHKTENILHNLIYPMKKDSEEIENPYSDHNLWLLDEKLVFSQYVVSDKSIYSNGKRIDLAIFGNKTVFRDSNTPSSPIFVYELKRPWEELENKNPIEQITEYIRKIRSRELNKDFNKRPIAYNENTPIYGFVVCDIDNPKVKRWIENAQYKIMPDWQGYYSWHPNYNAFIQVFSWDKVVDDAEKRHQAFFKKLWIE